MIGIIPAAGRGSRIQPLAFSKELLPVGSRGQDGVERPRAVSELLVERMRNAGVDRFLFVIAPGKTDIVEFYGPRLAGAEVAYVVQPEPLGLCDAIFRALPFCGRDERVVVGLPDTIWFPDDALRALPADRLAFLLFPVEHPERFDAVETDAAGAVLTIQVKRAEATTPWIRGAFSLPVAVLAALHALWLERGRADEYVGTLVNAWLGRGGAAVGVRAGTVYLDVGTVRGYREAIELLALTRP